jgi:hypothetical protein
VLQQPNGAFAGLLRLMTMGDIHEGVPVELIAISTGVVTVSDLLDSFERRVFETGRDTYSDDIEHLTLYYGAEWIT